MKGYITTQITKEAKGEIEILIGSPLDPKEFFKNGEGLRVWSGFEERLLKKVKQLKGPLEFKLETNDLVQNANDKQIEESLGGDINFKESELCAILAHLISEQPKGKKGLLLNDGNWNLFYTPSCVVRVYWLGGGWFVRAWGRDDGAWLAGGRVFSPQLTLDL